MPTRVECKLSVIVTVYNHEKYLDQAIRSILDQTFSDFELLIADDGSHDRSKEIANAYSYDSRVKTMHNGENIGKVDTVNRLFSSAVGKYITVHDSDDWSDPFRFQKQLNFMENHPEIGFCGTNFYIEKQGGVSKNSLELDPSQIKKNLLKDSQLHGPTIVFRRDLIKDGNVYRNFFFDYGEDYDLCLRLIEKSEAANLEDYLYHYRITKHSLSRKLTVRKLFLHDIARHLATQRKTLGKDDIQLGNEDQLELLIASLAKKFDGDPSRIHIKQAELDMYYKFFGNAIKNSLKAIWSDPKKFRNYRTLQYCLRKAILFI